MHVCIRTDHRSDWLALALKLALYSLTTPEPVHVIYSITRTVDANFAEASVICMLMLVE